MNTKEATDFILDEILNPFTESCLYEDYEADYEQRAGKSDFADKYDAAVAFIGIAPELLEAAKALDSQLFSEGALLSIGKSTRMAWDELQTAIAKAEGREN